MNNVSDFWKRIEEKIGQTKEDVLINNNEELIDDSHEEDFDLTHNSGFGFVEEPETFDDIKDQVEEEIAAHDEFDPELDDIECDDCDLTVPDTDTVDDNIVLDEPEMPSESFSEHSGWVDTNNFMVSVKRYCEMITDIIYQPEMYLPMVDGYEVNGRYVITGYTVEGMTISFVYHSITSDDEIMVTVLIDNEGSVVVI